MPDLVPYEIRNWYAHMGPADREIWEQFINDYPLAYDHVQYDVPLGSVPPHALQPLSPQGGTAERLYKRKIDVVGYKNDTIDILEIKPIASISSVGQVLGYQSLYMRDFSPPVKPRAIILCGDVDLDTREIAQEQGVQIIMV